MAFSLKKVLSYYWEHASKYKWYCIFAFICFAGAVFLSSIMLPLFYRDIVDIIAESSDRWSSRDGLFDVFKLIVLVVIGANILYRMRDYLYIRFQAKAMRDLSDFTFASLEKHSYSFFADQFVGSVTAKTRRFIHSFDHIMDMLVFRFSFVAMEIIGVLTVLFIVEPIFGWIFLTWIIAYLLLTYLRTKKQKEYSLKEASADSEVTATLADVMSNILVVKMFSAEQEEINNFSKKTRKQERKRMKSWGYSINSILFQGIMLAGLETIAVYTAIILWLDGSITTGTIVLVQAYIIRLVGGLLHVGQRVTWFIQEGTRAYEMIEILETDIGVKNPSNPNKIEVTQGEIVFDKVHFQYSEENSDVLKSFSLKIKSGEKIGLVGPSGAGKSTITKILLRFIDVKKGSVKIDNQSIDAVNQEDLRDKIAYVPQDALLFHRTIKENIAYGKPDANMKDIVSACKKARIHNFINKLPKKYDTMVGERGIKLSGGEKQRIAIARAILKNAPILVLDEATSSLDTVSEVAIKDALRELMKGKTTLVIAHRLSTVRELDRIIVLNGGKIVEEGSHKQLLNKKGFYASLWNHQTGENVN